MSVFTPVTLGEARAFVAPYNVGDVIDFQDIAAGVENSNFFVTTTSGRYVLTIFEKIPRADLDFYMELMQHLHRAGVRCAAPVANSDGQVLQNLKGKPAALVHRLSGGDIAHPTAEDCFVVGTALALMHAATSSFKMSLANWRGLAWWRHEAESLEGFATRAENALIQSEVGYQSGFDELRLPRGIVHAHLFPDHVLWNELPQPQMSDFYFACNEQLLWDVAITVNDWCLDFSAYPVARLDGENTRALLAGYASVRRLTLAEREAWPQMLRAAALRTWLGRLGYHYYPRSSTLTHTKDHLFSENLLRYFVAQGRETCALLPD
ncbi:MAG: homoserine kinase [Betaproteobacteria bacterium]